MTAKIYVSQDIDLSCIDADFSRADIIFHQVDHSGASFEAAVFLNNKDANETTPTELEQGYAGSFHIFGHGGCSGGVGHCEIVTSRRMYDPRSAHPLTPARKIVIATDAIREALTKGPSVQITVVPTVTGGTERCNLDDVLQFERISIFTYC